jgi:sugar O-acyltransferase (sialic acid O-acetyltransferase NeuD family)
MATDLIGELGSVGCFTDDTMDLTRTGDVFLPAVGDGWTRKRMADRGTLAKLELGFYCSPDARVFGPEVQPGCIILAGAVIMRNTRIGRGVLVNIGALVGHDCVLEDWCSIQPGAALTGRVHVEEGAYVGINATLIARHKDRPLRIGRGAIVGGGAVVLEDVPEGRTVVGNPARVLP